MPHSDRHLSAMTQAGLNLIQQALSIYGRNLRLVQCNRRFQEMFDLPEALVTVGASFEDTIRHLVSRGEYGEVSDPEAFVAVRVEQARAFEPHYMERPRSNGRWISVEGAPLPQGGWVTVYTDITRTKEQEQLLRTRSELLSEEVLRRSEELARTNRQLASTISALEETQRQLRAIEARTRLTTEMMPAHIAHVDSSGRYTYSNQRLTSVIPGRPSDIVGMSIAEALGPDAFAKVQPHLAAALAGQPSTFEFTDAPSLRRIRASFTPDQHENGVYILSMDVTEETQTRVALQQTRRREIAAQLTSGLAHDFSNLLTIILGMQSKLSRMPDLPDDAAPLISATLSAARRGGTLLGRIADMTASRRHRPVATRIEPFLQELAVLAGPSLPPGVTLHLSADVPGAILFDPGMLQDSLLNLILNARDACGEAGAIHVAARIDAATWLSFEVRDTGPGFTEAALRHGAEPFFTTKGGEGSGLGLAMVYDATKLAGGDLKLWNTEAGAQVLLRLPLRPAPEVEEADPGMVLLVEDNADLRGAIRDMLTGLGWRVVEAASVAEAQALIDGLPEITSVLTDIQLEGAETGLDLATDCTVPVALMTSLPADHALYVAAAALGPVLRKPFSAAQLAAALGESQDAP
ncbi:MULTISPECIES: PAS-domain containing protein [Marinovum]|jgi:signal transduction histidine kinase/CheY-like chemotaxis protein|nr:MULTISPECIES: PAS-domain containing protein [Marinovum]MDD9738413.1 PAS-domain containing protein [Marinovum sp. SP66]MDD9745542.1 PAS-domain containing protein [Marinovum sp. PR37]